MKHFTEAEDILFLKEVRSNPPFHVKHGKSGATWRIIADKLYISTKRVIKVRSLQDHFNVLIKTFKLKEAKALAATGTSEKVTEKDILLRDCVDLMKSLDPSSDKSPEEGGNSKELGLARLRDKSETSEYNDSELGSLDTRSSRSSNRNQMSVLVDLLEEQMSAARTAAEERATLKRNAIEVDRNKMEFEKEKHREDLELRRKQQEADIELRKQQQEANNTIARVLASFVSSKNANTDITS